MDKYRIIGREKEQNLLKTLCDKQEAQLISIYGRRRVGKTYLVKCFFNNDFDFFFTGSYNVSTPVQLSLFSNALQQYSHTPQPIFKSWFEAFSALQSYLSALKKERIVVFIDEIPWMDMPNANFISAFSYFWNSWGSAVRLRLGCSTNLSATRAVFTDARTEQYILLHFHYTKPSSSS